MVKENYKVQSIKKELCKEWLLYKHYAKRIPSISYAFGLYDLINGTMVGCCTYGLPASKYALFICGEENKNYVIELNRLIKNDGLPRNTQSWFVAQTFNLLPKPLVILSFSDCNKGHNGYTYQALNFIYTGKGGRKHEYSFKNKQYHSRHINKKWVEKRGGVWDENLTRNENFTKFGGKVITQKLKNRYIYFIGNKKQKKYFRKKLKFNELPYPKIQNTNYKTNYKTTTQTELF